MVMTIIAGANYQKMFSTELFQSSCVTDSQREEQRSRLKAGVGLNERKIKNRKINTFSGGKIMHRKHKKEKGIVVKKPLPGTRT